MAIPRYAVWRHRGAALFSPLFNDVGRVIVNLEEEPKVASRVEGNGPKGSPTRLVVTPGCVPDVTVNLRSPVARTILRDPIWGNCSARVTYG